MVVGIVEVLVVVVVVGVVVVAGVVILAIAVLVVVGVVVNGMGWLVKGKEVVPPAALREVVWGCV